MLIDMVPVIIPEFSKDQVLKISCDKMCGLCKYNIHSGLCYFFNGDKEIIPNEYLIGKKACPHFEQVFSDKISENEKKRYKQLISEWKKQHADEDNRIEVDG